MVPPGSPRWGRAPASLPHLLSGACPSVRPSGLRTAASEGPLRLPRDSRGRTGKGLDGAGRGGKLDHAFQLPRPPTLPRRARSAPARAEKT